MQKVIIPRENRSSSILADAYEALAILLQNPLFEKNTAILELLQQDEMWAKAYSLSLQILKARLPQATLDTTSSINNSIELLYDPGSSLFCNDFEQGFLVSLSVAIHCHKNATLLAGNSAKIRCQLDSLLPWCRAVISAYHAQRQAQCMLLCEYLHCFYGSVDIAQWQQVKADTKDYLAVFFHLILNTWCNALTDSGKYELALTIADKCTSNAIQIRHEGHLAEALIQKASVLFKLNRLAESKQLYESIKQKHTLSAAQSQFIQFDLEHIAFLNTGDHKSGYGSKLGGLNAREQEEFFQIIECEMSGWLSEQQSQRKRDLLLLAFSEERLSALFDRVRDKYFQEQVLDYRDKYVLPKLEKKQVANIDGLLKSLQRAKEMGHTQEMPLLLKQVGMQLIDEQQQKGRCRRRPLKLYLKATMATNSLEEHLTQGEFLGYILSRSENDLLIGLADELYQYFNQLVLLARTHQVTMTPERRRVEVALRKSTVDNLLMLLVELAIALPKQRSNWLRCVGQMKRLFDFSGLQAHIKFGLNQYRQHLTGNDIVELEQLKEELAAFPIAKSYRNKQIRRHDRLLTLLLPLRSKTSNIVSETPFLDWELFVLDALGSWENKDYLGITPVYRMAGQWQHFPEIKCCEPGAIQAFISLLTTACYEQQQDEAIRNIQHVGMELSSLLLAETFLHESPACLPVSNTGMLQGVPLEALPIPKPSQVKWFGELTTTVLNTGSVKDIAWLSEPFLLGSVTLFAAADFAVPFEPLPGSAAEAKTIYRELQVAAVKTINLHMHRDANRHRFLTLSGTQAPEVLHISSHCADDPDISEFSVLALSKIDSDGNAVTSNIGFYDISLMDLSRTKLVVLSACSTHRGKMVQGESPQTLAWAFKAAGAHAVVGTRWPVHDEASRIFWRTFYRALLKPQPIVAALLAARKTLIQSRRWCHPIYWAAYQLIA